MTKNTELKRYSNPEAVGFLGWVVHKTMGTLVGFLGLDGKLLRVEDIA